MMSTCFLKIYYALLLLLLHTAGSILGFNWATKSGEVKCIERERQALLKFKQGLLDDSGMLSTWRDDLNYADCCKWKGIECSNETGHVQTLDLRGNFDTDYYLSGVINITLLIELQNMEYLDLSSNDFFGSHIPEFMGSFSNLRYLDLSYSGIGGRIPYQLGNLAQLKYLDLKGNSLIGAIPFQFGNLPMLQSLRLGYNSDLKMNDAEWLSSLSSLTNLDLSLLNLGSPHHRLQIIRKLLPNLRELRLSGCSLSDNDILFLFDSHSNISTSLTILDLSSNMLTSSAFQSVFNFSFNLKELYLSNNNFGLSFPPSLNYHSLVILDLSYNNLTSLIFQGNFGSKLQKLHIQSCNLLDSSFLMPPASIINSSSSLVFLDLSSNLLTSSAIFHWLSNFTTNLHTLDLYDNLLGGPIPDGFGKVMNSLESLQLSRNKLQGEIPTSFGNICRLKTFYLSTNNLSGEISSFIQNSSMCNRHKFQILDLSYNLIRGMLPDFSNFSSLRQLELSGNRLIGEIPKSIGLLYELESLSLDGNSLEGDVTESHFTNLSKLKALDLSDNSLSLKLGNSWVPPFQIRNLGLASCKLGPSFPSWIKTQRYLRFLDISDAGIIGFVPEWFWNKLGNIGEMNMSHNNLIGTIPNLPLKLTNRPLIIMNSNQFEGGVPAFLSQASALDLSNNKISNLFTFLCGKSATANLCSLDLSDNQIKGQLPDCWETLNSLLFLDLSNNRLSGKIPLSMGTLFQLEALVLRNNSLIGELPSTLKNCTDLVILDVDENMLFGPIPSWIGESLQQLKILSLRVNRFFGTLPSQLCYLRQIHVLDLSRNNLSNGIPTCLKNFTAMAEKSIISIDIVRKRLMSPKEVYSDIYQTNVLLMWKGVEYVFRDIPELLLKCIDLSSNNLTGEIPREFGQLLGLVSLNLSRNNLNGEILPEIGNLSSLEFLDLSRNHFSGIIPSTLSQIDRLAKLDLSNNCLEGKIPVGRQLQTFDASSFEGNLDLCGKPLDKRCPEDETPVKPQESAELETDENSVFHEALYMSMGIGFFTGFWGLIVSILLWRPWRIAYLRFLNKLTDYVYVMVAVNVAKFQKWLNSRSG